MTSRLVQRLGPLTARAIQRPPGHAFLAACIVLLTASNLLGQAGQAGLRVGIDVDNDVLATIATERLTDFEYTHGTRLWVESDRLGLLPWLLGDPLACRSSGACRHRVILSQELYTPRRDSRKPIEGERPFAAWLYIAAETVHATDRASTRLGVLVGIVGPDALGEDVQRAVHERFGFPILRGWEHQLPLEPTVQLRIARERRLTSSTQGPVGYGVVLASAAELGNALITGSTQLSARLCLGRPRCASPRPDRPRGPGLELRGGIGTRAVLRNVFLDGTLRESHSVKKQHLIPTATGSVIVRLLGLEITYELRWRAREYESEPAGFTYGTLAIGYGW